MTEVASKNGRQKPELGEKGFSSETDDLFSSDRFPYETDEPKPKDYEEMFGEDTQAEALLRGVTLPVTGAAYEIEDAEGGAKEGEFVRDVLLKPTHEGGMTTPMSSVLAQMCAGFAHPLVFFEKVWPDPKEADGKYVYKKIALRPAETCRIKTDEHGGFDGFVQEGYRQGRSVRQEFGVDKAFVYVHRGGEKPLKGRSSFKAVYKKYKHKKRVEWLFFDNLQTFTRGIRAATYGGEDLKGAQALFKRVEKVEGAGTVVLGKDDNLEVLRTPGVSAEYKEALNYLDSQMARALLAQWLNLGQDGKTGTYALSRDHSDFFLQSMQSVLDEIAWHINNFLIPPLVKYNFGLSGKAPKWVFQPLSENAKKEALEIGRELMAKGQLKPKPGLLTGIEEKMAQALEIDPEKLEGEEEEAEDVPDDAPAPEGLQRAIGALQALGGGQQASGNVVPIRQEEELDKGVDLGHDVDEGNE